MNETMKIVIMEGFLVAVGLFCVIYGGVLFNGYMERSGAAKSYDQTHRCVASVMYMRMFWSAGNATQTCGLPENCTAAIVPGEKVAALLVMAIVSRAEARWDDCRGVALGGQLTLEDNTLPAPVAQSVARAVMGRTGRYFLRFSDNHKRHFVYNASITTPAVDNDIRPSVADPDMHHWIALTPLAAIMMLVGFACIACGVMVDAKQGAKGVIVTMLSDDDGGDMELIRPLNH